MRLVIFDIQRPVDPQVNGFGIYRTVVDGAEPELIGRFEIPLFPHYSHTHPWESADCTGMEDTELTLNFAKGSVNTFNEGIVYCVMTQIWEAIDSPSFHLNSEDANGYVCTYPWEMRGEWGHPEGTPVSQTKFTWALTTIENDASLGEAVETDHDLPPSGSLVTEFQESIFIAGIDQNPHYLVWSKRFHPESFPSANFLEVGDANDPITSLVPIAGVLGCFTRDTKYRVNGNASSGFVHFEAISHRGTRAYKSAVPTEHGIIFVANDGCYSTNLIGADEKLSDEIDFIFNPEGGNSILTDNDRQRTEEPLNQAFMHLVSGCYFKTKYRFVYPSGTSEVINREAVFDFFIKKWFLTDIAVASYLVEEDLDYLTAGGNDEDGSYLYRLENTDDDDGFSINFEWHSKEFAGQSLDVRNVYCYFRIDALVPLGESLTADFYADGEFVQSHTITGLRTQVLNPLPENTQGFKWQIRLSGSTNQGGIKIYGFSTYFIPLAGLANGT